jgi:hypothetical protein
VLGRGSASSTITALRSWLPESRMADRPRKPLFPNPFYVVLLLSSTAFVITALAYFVSPMVEQKALAQPGAAQGAASRTLAHWFDRNGPLALGVEFTVMFVFGVLAMATDHWFAPKAGRRGDGRE